MMYVRSLMTNILVNRLILYLGLDTTTVEILDYFELSIGISGYYRRKGPDSVTETTNYVEQL